MKKIILLTIMIITGLQLNAQQDAQYTQFMFNKLALNPGYAGSKGVPCLTALYRNQWVGLEGSPVTQALSFHTPIRKRVGIGLSIVHDNIGPSKTWNTALSYAYRIHFKTGTLSLGVQAALRSYRVDWTKSTTTLEGDDLVMMADASAKLLPNFGAGLYYQSNRFYFGLSVPHLIKGDISLLEKENSSSSEFVASQNIHAFLMAGMIVDLTDNIKFKPGALLKYVENSPLDLDINFSLLFVERLWFGVTYRMGGSSRKGFGESIDLVAQYRITETFKLGLAFDFTLSELSNYNRGSFEVMGQYCFKGKNEVGENRFSNPRFFF